MRYYLLDVNHVMVWRAETPGVIMLGVDNLPAEFPREASEHFSNKLAPFIAELAVPEGAAALSGTLLCAVVYHNCASHPGVELVRGCFDLDALVESMTGATIASGGKLAPDFQYITVCFACGVYYVDYAHTLSCLTSTIVWL